MQFIHPVFSGEDISMRFRIILTTIAAMFLLGMAAFAHHSFAGSYIEDKTVTIEGKVVEFNIRNPHSFISIEVTDKDGKATRWGAEWAGVTQLTQSNVNRFSLEYGDKIVIDGAPSRDSAEHKVLVRQVTRPATATTPEFKWGGRVQ